MNFAADTFLKALLKLKDLYDQHRDNKDEIKRLKDSIGEYKKKIRELRSRIKEAGAQGKNVESALKDVEKVMREATTALQEWATDQSFFRMFNSAQRMQELERLQTKVKDSMQGARDNIMFTLVLRLQPGANLHRPHDKPKISDQAAPASKPTNPKPMIKHDALLEDHQLAAAEHGVVYVISKDPKTRHSNLWIQKGQRGKLLNCTNRSQPGFRATSPPFVSRNDVLYLGVRSERRPMVRLWKAEQSLRTLHSPRADTASWEYTFLTESASTRILYCGCSDGAIEIWKSDEDDPTKPRVYNGHLSGHAGGIRSLATGENGTLLSTDMKHSNVVKVWSNLKEVGTLDVKPELSVRTLACTFEKKVYAAAKDGTRLWCDLKKTNFARKPVEAKFALLRKPGDNGSGKNARSCAVVNGMSETVCVLTRRNQGTYSIEEWCGNSFVSRVDTELKAAPAWTVSQNGTVYWSSRVKGELWMRKLHEK